MSFDIDLCGPLSSYLHANCSSREGLLSSKDLYPPTKKTMNIPKVLGTSDSYTVRGKGRSRSLAQNEERRDESEGEK